MSILVICAWCSAHIETKEGDAPCPISHGICSECAEKVRAETEEILKSNNPKIKQTERRI